MQSKSVSKRASLVAILSGFAALSPALLIYFIPNLSIHRVSPPPIENTAALSGQEEVIPELPVRLKIPKISVDAPVEYVGLTPDGAMDVPKERANVAWFELGQRPGANGSAVIAGHYGWKNQNGSVFDNLHKLRKGDKLYVEDEKGGVISFVVRESRRYDSKADASSVFGSNDGGVHLNLVTCEGEWDSVSQSYPKRLVVFTDKE